MLSIYLTEICADIQEETHTKMSLAALSLVIRNCKPNSVEYDETMKLNKVQLHAMDNCHKKY